jgi:hypothetical protein
MSKRPEARGARPRDIERLALAMWCGNHIGYAVTIADEIRWWAKLDDEGKEPWRKRACELMAVLASASKE